MLSHGIHFTGKQDRLIFFKYRLIFFKCHVHFPLTVVQFLSEKLCPISKLEPEVCCLEDGAEGENKGDHLGDF